LNDPSAFLLSQAKLRLVCEVLTAGNHKSEENMRSAWCVDLSCSCANDRDSKMPALESAEMSALMHLACASDLILPKVRPLSWRPRQGGSVGMVVFPTSGHARSFFQVAINPGVRLSHVRPCPCCVVMLWRSAVPSLQPQRLTYGHTSVSHQEIEHGRSFR